MNNGARLTANPHNRNVANTVPTVEISIQVVAWQRSTNEPIIIHPKTEARFNRMTVSDAVRLFAPSERAYVGR
ncbi:hypothetical protein GCM10025794_34650 [Massilia kyonggiensis]